MTREEAANILQVVLDEVVRTYNEKPVFAADDYIFISSRIEAFQKAMAVLREPENEDGK